MGLFAKDKDDFLLYCQLTKQYSENTVRNYKNTLDRFEDFLVNTLRVEQSNMIDLDVVNAYRQFLNKKNNHRGGKLSLKAQAYQIVVLRSFLKFMLKSGVVVLNPDSLELPRTRMNRIEYLTENEVWQLTSAILEDSRKIPVQTKKRNQAIILTLFGSGLRLSELLKIKKTDLTNEEGQLIIEGKGGKVRSTFLAPAAKEAIDDYLKVRGFDDCPFLFVSFSRNRPKNSRHWKPLTPRMVQMVLQNYAHRMGIYKHITPHTLRHSFATKILFEGGDLRSIQTLLGHANLSTTQIYTHITDWQIRSLHKKVFGKMKKNKPKLKSQLKPTS